VIGASGSILGGIINRVRFVWGISIVAATARVAAR
jgi:hypothetical protein